MKINEIILEDYELLSEADMKVTGDKILQALAWGLQKGAKGVFWVVTNPIKAISLAAVATHPKGAWNLANLTFNLISDPVATGKILANQITPWADSAKAASDLSMIIGDNLPSAAITGLAKLAVSYALPVAGVIALLYGGNKLYNYLKSKNALPPEQPAQQQKQPLKPAYNQTVSLKPQAKPATAPTAPAQPAREPARV